MAQQMISHFGVVDSIAHNCVNVRILQASACSSCSAAKLCRSGESKEKVISVVTNQANLYEVGQEVTIVGSVKQGLQATLWAYVIPLVLMVALMILTSRAGFSDALSAVSTLALLAIYYLIMYVLRGKFEKKFAFVIK